MAEAQLKEPNGPLFPGSNFIKGATGMPVVRQVTLLVALAASVAMAIVVAMWVQTPDYRPIGSPKTPGEASEIVNALEAHQIPTQVDQRTGTILVPAERIFDARMALAEDGVVGEQMGYEILDREQGFGVSQFREYNDHRRAVEGELAKNIMAINAVYHARVILATPKTTTFLRDRRKPSASVTLTLKPGRDLNQDKIRGIMNLVAGGVPDLDPSDVVVVDQSGTLLSNGAVDDSLLRSQQDLDLVHKIEGNLYDKVANILSKWAGRDRFSAEISAEVDFTRAESTQEQYNPELSVVRSEQQTEEQELGIGGQIGGIPGTLSNQPPELADAPTENEVEETKSTRVSSTRNFEVDRTIRHTRQQVGRIQRLSIAVVVDYRPVTDAETGVVTNEAWSEEELAALTEAVKSAAGFREERGDTVSVVNREFYRAPTAEVAPTPFYEQNWFSGIIKQVLGGLAFIVVILGLLRPLFKNLSQAGELVREQQSLAIADSITGGGLTGGCTGLAISDIA
ncbi:MAG: flagellar M-ring protein FliF [Pseudomonadales bacterium]|nr:flagellar M-ring protein FliF [Pseudomonadales bacterium]